MDSRTRLAMTSFAALIALLVISAYLSSDRAQTNPNLKAVFETAQN